MKKLYIALGLLLSLNLSSQIDIRVKRSDNDLKLKVEKGYKYTPSKQLSTRAGDTSCSVTRLSYTLFDYIQQEFFNNNVTLKGNWYQATPDPLATTVRSSNLYANKFFTKKVVMKFDRIIKNVFTATSYDTAVLSKSTIRLDSLTIFGNIARDTTEIDSVKNDSLIISVYNSSNGVVGTKIFDSIYTGNQLKKFMIGNQSIGSRTIPFKHQFAKGQTFSISIEYMSSKRNSYYVCHGYADSCGNAAAVAPKLFNRMAEFYFWDSTSPSTVAESRAIVNNFRFTTSPFPVNCTFVEEQTFYIIPMITICEELQGSLVVLPETPCYKQNATAYSIVNGGKPPYTYSWTTTGGLVLSTNNLDSANFIMNASGGNINLTVTDAASNTITLTKNLGVYTPIVNTVTYSPNSTSLNSCNDSITITVSSYANTTYAWSSSSSTTNKEVAKKAGTYTVTLTFNPTGCKFDTTLTITSKFTVPTLDFSFSPSTVCPNEDVTFTITPSAYRPGWNYVWKDGTTNLGTVNPLTTKFTSSGTKKIYLSADSNGCAATDVFKNFVVKTTTQCKPAGASIQDVNSTLAKIYPNPVKNGEISIESAQSGKMQVRIIDILGKQIQANEFKNAGINKLDVSNLGNGVYFVELETKQGKQIEKIIVDK